MISMLAAPTTNTSNLVARINTPPLPLNGFKSGEVLFLSLQMGDSLAAAELEHAPSNGSTAADAGRGTETAPRSPTKKPMDKAAI